MTCPRCNTPCTLINGVWYCTNIDEDGPVLVGAERESQEREGEK